MTLCPLVNWGLVLGAKGRQQLLP